MSRPLLTYRIDADNRIAEVDEAWEVFARQNDCPGLTRDAVLSRPLLSFIGGGETQLLVKMLLKRARAGERVAVPFRCDSPSERRELLFEAVGLPDGSVRCSTRLLQSEPRPSQALIDLTAERTEEVLILCSWCQRARIGASEWVEIEEAVKRLGLLQDAAMPLLSHGVCPDCVPLMRGTARA